MTNKDAIAILKQVNGVLRYDPSWEDKTKSIVDEAFGMAIEALKPKSVLYHDCADAIMMMWTETIITDSQYNKIMGQLNKWRWGKDDE